MISSILSKEKVNTSRQIEVDLFRGFTAIILIICHVFLYLGDNGDNTIYVIGDIIGSEFGAPVFMAMMGISMIFTNRNTPKDLLHRGISIFLVGVFLNIVRSLVPFLLFPDVDWFATLDSLFVIDILPFAGLSFAFCALLKKLKVPSWGIVLISIVFAGVGEWIFTSFECITDNHALGLFLNLFVPYNEYSCFPFLTWFFFPALGCLLGDILIRTKDKTKLYLIYLIVGFVGVAIIYGSFIIYGEHYQDYYAGGNFYYQGVLNLLLNGLAICFGLALWYFVSKIIPKFFSNYLVFLSKNLNVFYIVSWVIIGGGLHIMSICEYVMPTYLVLVLTLVVLIATSLITWLFEFIKEQRKIKQEINKNC